MPNKNEDLVPVLTPAENAGARTSDADGEVMREARALPYPGEYWEAFCAIEFRPTGKFDAKSELPVGTLCLVTGIDLVEDDEIQNVEIVIPPPYTPKDPWRRNLKWTLPEFSARFVRSREDGAMLRRQQLDQFNAELASAKDGLKGDIGKLTATSLNPARLLAAPDDGSAGAGTLRSRRDLVEVAAGAAIAEFEERAENLTHCITVAAAEIGAQAMASTFGARRLVSKVETALSALSAYVGDEVEVVPVVAGERTAPGTPITVFQAARYMDEEYLVHLKTGGADYTHWQDFIAHLAERPDILERVLPDRHSLCLMRYRRKERIYATGDNLGALYASVLKNMENRKGFLLYRCGDAVWRIDSPVTELAIKRLFPTEEDMRKPFESNWREEGPVTRDSVRYKDSYDERERTLVTYRRLLLTLAGIQDREHLFAGLPKGGDILDAAGREDVFRWIHDDERLLGDDREPLFGWLKRHQEKHLAVGARVLCDWRNLRSGPA